MLALLLPKGSETLYDTIRLSADAPATPAYTRETREIAGVRVDVAVGVEQAQQLLPNILSSDAVSVDVETRGVAPADRWRITAVGIGDPTGTKVVILDPRDPRQAELIRDTLNRAPELHVHNAAFDVPILLRAGLLSDTAVTSVWDTLVIARMANPGGQNSLTGCAARLLGLPAAPPPWAGLPGKWSAARWYREADISRARYLDGLAADVSITARLEVPLMKELRRLYSQAPFWGTDDSRLHVLIERENTIVRMMARRCAEGLPADLAYADEFRDRYSVDIQLREARLGAAGISASTPATMATWLTDHGHIDRYWKRTPTGKPSTEKKLIKALAKRVPEVADYLTVRAGQKMFGYLDTITASVSETGLVHPTFNICAARTGRMSVSDPALQQFPAAARGILLSPFESGLASCDWSSIEVVMAAAVGRDAGLLGLIHNGRDPYTLAMEAAGIDRDTAKVVILAGQYGQRIASLARTLGTDLDAAKRVRENVFGSMPGVQTLMGEMTRIAERGYMATVSGRVIPITRDPATGRRKTYTGTNYVIQGSSYDLMADALAEVDRRGLSPHVMLSIHDELVIEDTAEVKAEISEIMSTPPARLLEHVGDLPLTLRAEPEPLGERWGKPGKSADLKTFDADDLHMTDSGEDD